MDTIQLVLLTVIIILTALLILLGMQVFYILKEIRQTLHRVNRMMNDIESITGKISGGVSSISSLTAGLKAGAIVASLFKKFKHKVDEEEEYGQE